MKKTELEKYIGELSVAQDFITGMRSVISGVRAYCYNPACKSFNNGLWWWKDGGLKKYTE